MYRVAKRYLDLVLISVGLIFLAPLMLLIAIAIKLNSPGPIIYRNNRVGKDGRPFAMYKFRTMRVHPDTEAELLYIKRLLSGELGPVKGEPSYKLSQDPRITSVGRFLRKFSLDELPQLFNVLKGDMSLVGPRPSVPFELEHYQEWQKERLNVVPGITGWWLVSGNYEGGFDEMIKMDIEYVRKQSLLFDLKILLRTTWAVLWPSRA